MDKAKKKRIRKYITWVCILSVVAVLTLMPVLAGTSQHPEGPQASTLSGTVETGTITTNLFGGGTLRSEAAVEITLPSGVKITEFLVSNGDDVSEGDPLALIDHVSVMSAITEVQDTMDYLVEEMAQLSYQQQTFRITAKAGGLVKQVFAKAGDDVQDIMLQHGALAVLSLDGRMAVDIPCNTALATGDSVSVILDDASMVPGRVESNMDGILVVTVEDDGYEVGRSVQVTTTEGTAIGSGDLYVHNAWRAVAYSGTVDSVTVQPETQTYAGQLLLTLKQESYTGQQESLASQHRKYEDLMLKLFQLYQAEAILAPCDGIVSGVDEESIHLLSANDNDILFDFLVNAPGSDPDRLYDNHVGQYIAPLGSQWIVRINPQSQDISDYKTGTDSLDLSEENMTYQTMMDPVTVYQLTNGQWEIGEAVPGDILVFALGEKGFVWAVRIPTEEPPRETTLPSEPQETTAPAEEPEEPSQPEEPTEPEIPSEPEEENPSDSKFPTMGGSFGGMLSGIMGGLQQEPEIELYDLEETVLLSVVPQNEMTLTIQLDQRDIGKVTPGMQAEVTVEALHATFPGVITKIGTTGTNLGGSSRFSVELLLKMEASMLAGMTATATIPLSVTENAALIPVEALVEENSRTVVYTGYDEKTDTLTDPVDVVCGNSDGTYVQILSGLDVGDPFWYRYYDTLEIDHSVDEPSFNFG